jgi:hypothetical protein
MPKEKILQILMDNVFPYVSEKEIIKVDFKVTTSFTVVEDIN